MSIIELVIEPAAKNLGDEFIVRRSLPVARKRAVGPFIFWDHMGPLELAPKVELKVRAHPHIGLATITYLFSGEIMHRDSLGNEQAIRPGEVNWMTAGRGISHSERSTYKNRNEILEGIQLWVALPKEKEDIEPNFSHFKENDLPLVEVNSHKLRLVAGEALGQRSSVPVHSDLFYFKGDAPAHAKFEFTLEAQQEAALYIVNGEIEVEGQAFKRFDMVVFKQGSKIEFNSRSSVEYMFFGGSVFPEKRFMWWNFVSTSEEKIERAKRNWVEQKFGQVINETEFTPLPEN